MPDPKPDKVVVEVNLAALRVERGLAGDAALACVGLLRVASRIANSGLCPAGRYGGEVPGAFWVVYPEGADRCAVDGS